MVFSSVPVYLDPPNWQQHTNHQQEASFNANINHQLPPLPPSAGGPHPVRPSSMAERARMAKFPQPEGPLKCPRCDSTNTKFCYYNNYSLTQPRHFCKACRRYWTRGGALRSVPVGGRCRKNKKSKSSSSRSTSASSAERQSITNSSADVLGNMQQPSQLPNFMPSFARFGIGNIGLNNIGFNVSGFHGQVEATNGARGQAGIEFGAAGGEILGSSNVDFPSFAGYETPIGLYNSLGSEGFEGSSSSSLVGFSQLRSMASNSGITQLAPVKIEENQVAHFPRTSLAIDENNQLWGANSWANFRDPNSSHLS